MRRWVWVVVLMTVAFMGYLMGLGDRPSPPPLPSDADDGSMWWNLWTGVPPARVLQILLFTAAAVIMLVTVWDLIRPRDRREPFKVINPPRQMVRRHRDPENGDDKRYRGIHRR